MGMAKRAFVLGLALAGASPAAAITLDFNPTACTPDCGNNSFFRQDYGDTTTVDVSYRSLTGSGASDVLNAGLQYWSTGYGDLTGVAWGGTAANFGVPEITFTVTQRGETVTLNALDYAGYPNTDRESSFRVYDLAYNLLFDSDTIGPVVFPGSGHGTQTFNISSATGLRLQWGPDGYNGGIDNLSFTGGTLLAGAVPEPATWATMIAGLGIAGGAMRRRRRTILA